MANPVSGMRELARRVAGAAPRDTVPVLAWAEVASTSPLRVLLDGDDSRTPLDVSANAVGPVTVGQRVMVARQGKRLTILAARPVDTGWILLPLAPGVTAGSVPPAVRRIGQVVYTRGSVTLTAPTTADWVQVASIPTGMTPAQYRRYAAGGYGSTSTFAAGTISVFGSNIEYARSGGPAGAPPGSVYLDLSWPID